MRKTFTLLTLLFSLLVISCSNIAGDSSSLSIIEKNKLSILVDAADTNFKFTKGRSISPSALTSEDLDFYLSGTNETYNKTIETQKVSFKADENNSSTGKLVLYLDPGIYTLTLSAVKKGDVFTAANTVLKGISQTDLRTDNDAYFSLTSNHIQAAGTIKLAIYTIGWQTSPSMDATVGIYRSDNMDTPIYEQNHFNLYDYHYNSQSDVPATVTYNYTADGKKLMAGTYNFKVTIRSNNIDYYYSDKIIIEPNRETEGSIAIPHIVANEADAPSDLIARYQKPETANLVSYPVEFTWTDNSNTESGFELELLRLDDYLMDTYPEEISRIISTTETVSSKNTAWDSLKSAAELKNQNNVILLDKEFYKDDYISTILEGGLSPNSRFCTYNLELDYSYLARIRATADGGNSEFCYLDLPNSKNMPFAPTSSPKPYYNWNSSAKTINLYCINYELNGGSFFDNSDYRNVTNIIKTYDFYYETSAGTEILNPINFEYDSSKTASLKYSTHDGISFIEWKINRLNGQNYDLSQKYTGRTSLTLFADYGNGIGQNKYELVSNNNILIYTNTENQLSNTIIDNPEVLNQYNYCRISKTKQYAIVTLKNIFANAPNNSTSGVYDPIFSKVTFTISEQGNAVYKEKIEGNTVVLTSRTDTSHYNYYSLDLTGSDYYKSGKTYNIIIEAKAGARIYSTTVIIEVTE